MKKIMLCAAVIVAAMAMTGCKKVCSCSAEINGVHFAALDFDADLTKQSLYKSCKDLQNHMNAEINQDGASYTCK